MLGARLAALGFAKKFNPLQLFQKGAVGAWYDPSSLWGASDHLPRRNLLTYTEDFSNAVYTKSGVTASTNTTTDPIGGSTADSVLETTATGHVFYQTINVISGVSYTFSFYVNGISRDYIFGFMGGAGFTSGSNIAIPSIRLSTRDVVLQPTGAAARSDVTCTAVDAGASWVRVSITTSAAATNSALVGVYIATGPNFDDRTYTGDITKGIYFWGAQLSLASTLDQSYQKVTDWTTELYAHAASKNVPWLRRNRFLNTATLSTQTVTSVTATPLTVSFTGTGTITFSTAYVGTLVGTGASDRVTATFTPSAGNLVCTVTGSVTLAQCEVASAATEYQPIGASWESQYAANAAAAGVALTMYQDSAGTTPVTGPDSVIGKLNDLSGNNYHAIQSGATGLKPTLRLCPNGCWYIEFDGIDDYLTIAGSASTFKFLHSSASSAFFCIKNNLAAGTRGVLLASNGYSSSNVGILLGFNDITPQVKASSFLIVRGVSASYVATNYDGTTSNSAYHNVFGYGETAVYTYQIDAANSTPSSRIAISKNTLTPVSANTFSDAASTNNSTADIDIGKGSSVYMPMRLYGVIILNAQTPTKTKSSVTKWLAAKAEISL